jgi:hypothetical protein
MARQMGTITPQEPLAILPFSNPGMATWYAAGEVYQQRQ